MTVELLDRTTEPRYLTDDGKHDVLAEWERRKVELRRPDGDIGGHGYADPEMFEWCDKLNAIEGVCTLQSCAGHVLRDARDDSPYVVPAQLWLWLSEPMARAFDQEAFRLAATRWPQFEYVRRLYHDSGQEIIDIVFRGAAHGQLDESMAIIVEFFRSLKDYESAQHPPQSEARQASEG